MTTFARRVAGGLDSLVMGEGQILAQVRQVYKVGQACPGFGRYLNGLFKQAITAGKRVRAETSIASGAVSVSSAAAELAQLKLPSQSFADAKVRPWELPWFLSPKRSDFRPDGLARRSGVTVCAWCYRGTELHTGERVAGVLTRQHVPRRCASSAPARCRACW